MDKQALKLAIDSLINKALKETNHFHRYWCIDDYYGTPSITRSSKPKELRARGKIVYAYGQYNSAYGGHKSRLIKTFKAYNILAEGGK